TTFSKGSEGRRKGKSRWNPFVNRLGSFVKPLESFVKCLGCFVNDFGSFVNHLGSFSKRRFLAKIHCSSGRWTPITPPVVVFCPFAEQCRLDRGESVRKSDRAEEELYLASDGSGLSEWEGSGRRVGARPARMRGS